MTNRSEIPNYVKIPEETHPPLEIDFDTLIAELRDLESKPLLNEDGVKNILEKIDECYDIETAKMSMRDKEAKDYKDCGESELFAEVLARVMNDLGNNEQFTSFINNLDLIKPKKFEKMKGEAAGTFHPLSGKITFSEKKFDIRPLQMIGELACYGYTESMKTLHHEVIHSKQSDRLKEYMAIIKNFIAFSACLVSMEKVQKFFNETENNERRDSILTEAHAYLGDARYSSSEHHSYYATSFLNEVLQREEYFIQGEPLIQNKKDADHLIAMSTAVKRLYALGLDDSQIGVLVKSMMRSNAKNGYNLLEKKVEELMKQRKLEEEDIDNLVLADDIKRKIYMNKVRIIAQEEIKKAFAEISKTAIPKES